MVDNHSTDASAEIVMRYPRVKLVFEEKRGAYAARNRGLREAKGEIIAFTDPDCVPFNDWLQRLAVVLEPPVGIVIGRSLFASDSAPLSLLSAYDHEKNIYVFNSAIKEVYFGQTNNMGVRKKLFDEVGPYVERPRGSDTIFVRRCVERYSCEVVRYDPTIRVRHMEVDGVAKLFRKFFIYGASRRRCSHIMYVRPLTNLERFGIFWRAVQCQKYSLIKSVFLLVLLALGLVN